MMKKQHMQQIVPVCLTVLVFLGLSIILYGAIRILNMFSHTDILLQVRPADFLVGMTIYLKTSVDFAIIIGNLMAGYRGWKNRIAIETGTALGNAGGTIIVLTMWSFFREIKWLLALMILLAAFVLLRLAQEGLEHARGRGRRLPAFMRKLAALAFFGLEYVNNRCAPFLKYIVPNLSMKSAKNMTFVGLFMASFTIPFILGLDDFAGYVPLFSIVNVFGFSVGVLAGHMILNMALFISPQQTIKVVKNPYISLGGSLVFVGLALWGFWEVGKLLFIH